jgi:hypothetical protein
MPTPERPSTRTRVRLTAEMPDADVQAFLQALRTWEQQHREAELVVSLDTDIPLGQMEEIFGAITPGFPFKTVAEKKEEG